jgi:hypothetical protein
MQEIHKELNDLAIQEFKSIQSNETGFVHSFYGKSEAPHQAVSVLDNFLFALALCRLKTIEGVQEGKALIEKLLAYQSPEGFFPVYLHEFPFIFDRHYGTSLLPVLFSIHRYFHRVLGSEMAKKLLNSIEKLLNASLSELPLMSLPNRFRVGGALVGYGELVKSEEWVNQGNALLDFQELLNSPSKFIPKHLGEAFSGALLAGGKTASDLHAWMKSLWHPELSCYAGHFTSVKFNKGDQETTLFDLFMLAEGNKVPMRFKQAELGLLKAALVFPIELFPSTEVFPKADMTLEKNNSCSWLSEGENKIGRYPFVFQWGSNESLSSLIFHAPLTEKVKFDGQNKIEIDMGPCPELETKEPGRELYWFLTPKEDLKILINGQTATTFREGDLLTIEDAHMRIELKFKTKGGVFQGHISKSCLPSEKGNFGKNRFEGFQWQLLWRTISREDNCPVTIHFSYAAKS